MLSLQHAARLLAAANSPAGLAALASTLGFTAPPLPVTGDLAATLGLPDAAEVAVVPGPGLLRLLLVRATGHTDDITLRHGIEVADTPFLRKPFTPSALVNRVQEVLDQGC